MLTQLSTMALWLTATTYAQVDPCTHVPSDPLLSTGGCQGNAQQLAANLADTLGVFMLVGAGALSVVFVVIGGFNMMISMGDDARAQNGKQTVIFAVAGLALTLAAQAIVSWAAFWIINSGATTNAEQPLVLAYAGIVSAIVGVFNAVFALVIIVAGFRLIMGYGSQDATTKAKSGVIWAIAGAAVVNLARWIVEATLLVGFG